MLSFCIKFVQTDGRTTVKQYAPQSFDMGAIKKEKEIKSCHKIQRNSPASNLTETSILYTEGCTDKEIHTQADFNIPTKTLD